MSGGAMCRVVLSQANVRAGKTRSRSVWRVELECGHWKIVETLPGKTARCPVCTPRVGSNRARTRTGTCDECGKYGPIRGRHEETGMVLCNQCHPNKKKPGLTEEARIAVETATLWGKRSERTYGPPVFWR